MSGGRPAAPACPGCGKVGSLHAMVDLSVHARLISTPNGGVALGPMTDSIKDIRAEVARSPLAAESDVVCHACLWAGTRDALPSAPAEGEAARPGTISILDVH